MICSAEGRVHTSENGHGHSTVRAVRYNQMSRSVEHSSVPLFDGDVPIKELYHMEKLDYATYLAGMQESFDGVPSYFERHIPGDGSIPVLIVVERCESCGHWHAPEDACPVLVEV